MLFVALSLWLACDHAEPPRQKLSSTSKAQETKPESGEHPPALVAPKTKPAAVTIPTGRWRGQDLCLELFANGDFEISLPNAKTGKELIMGSATIEAKDDDSFHLGLKVNRIWRARWISSCRKINNSGHWIDATNTLGTAMTKGETSEMRLRLIGDGKIEVCSLGDEKQCAALSPDTALMGKTWKRPDDGSDAVQSELVQIQLGKHGHLARLGNDDQQDRIYGKLTPNHQGADTFSLSFTPLELPDAEAAESIVVLGLVLRAETPSLFKATRLANQQIQLCGAKGQCLLLERSFESHDPGVEFKPDEIE